MVILACVLCFVLGAAVPLIAFWMGDVQKRLKEGGNVSRDVDEEESRRLKNLDKQWDNLFAYNGDRQNNSLD